MTTTVLTSTVIKYQLIMHILWHGHETSSVTIGEYRYKGEAYEEWNELELADELDRKEGNLPSYIEHEYEVKKVLVGNEYHITTYR